MWICSSFTLLIKYRTGWLKDISAVQGTRRRKYISASTTNHKRKLVAAFFSVFSHHLADKQQLFIQGSSVQCWHTFQFIQDKASTSKMQTLRNTCEFNTVPQSLHQKMPNSGRLQPAHHPLLQCIILSGLHTNFHVKNGCSYNIS